MTKENSAAKSCGEFINPKKAGGQRIIYPGSITFSDGASLIRTNNPLGNEQTAANEWVLRRYFNGKYSIAYRTLSTYLEGVQTMQGIDEGGRRRIFYHREEVELRLTATEYARKLDLPHIEMKTRRYVDPSGTSFVAGKELRRKFGVSQETLLGYLEEVDSVRGISKKGTETILFHEEDANKTLGTALAFRDLPQVNKQTQTYFDGNQEQWQTEKFLCKKHGLDIKTLRKAAKQEGVRCIPGRGATGHPSRLYNLGDVEIHILSLPKVDKESDEYLDSNGVCWVAKNLIHRVYGIHYRILDKILANCTSIKGRTKGGVTNLYNKEEILEILRECSLLEQSQESNTQGVHRRNLKRLLARLSESPGAPRDIFLSLPQERIWDAGNQYVAYMQEHPESDMDLPTYYVKVYSAQGGNKNATGK